MGGVDKIVSGWTAPPQECVGMQCCIDVVQGSNTPFVTTGRKFELIVTTDVLWSSRPLCGLRSCVTRFLQYLVGSHSHLRMLALSIFQQWLSSQHTDVDVLQSPSSEVEHQNRYRRN